MKLYTEEQVRDMLELTNLNVQFHLDTMIPIELPSDEEIEIKSQIIELEYHGMQYTNFNQGLKKGAELMAKWMKEQILNQNK